MWHLTQPTRWCGEALKAVYSGFITVWQVVPQNLSLSVYSYAW